MNDKERHGVRPSRPPELPSLTSRETLGPGAVQSRPSLPIVAPNLPARFGRYRIRRLLGQGAMGAVYLADDTKLERPVAIKIPKVDTTDDDEILVRFHREAKAAATLSHPNICPVHDVGEIRGIPYMSMSYVDGEPLTQRIGRGSPPTPRGVARLIRKLAFALQEAHDRGIVHRDLKPANIMVDQRGEPIVTDFGLSHHLDCPQVKVTKTGQIIGTPAYLAPEQIDGTLSPPGAHVDVYSLGVVMYELLTGEVPFDGPVAVVIGQIITRDPAPPSTLRTDIDPQLEAVCLKMMAKPVAERYKSMFQVGQTLTRYLNTRDGGVSRTSGVAISPPSKLEHEQRKIRDLTAEHHYTAAIETLQEWARSRDATAAAWAHEELVRIDKRRTQFIAGLPALGRTAEQLLEKHNYESAADLLQQIPVEYRDTTTDDLLTEALSRQDEVSFLGAEIEAAIETGRHEGLVPKVKQLLDLKPGNTRARELDAQLTRRRVRFAGRLRRLIRLVRGDGARDAKWGLFAAWMLAVCAAALATIVGATWAIAAILLQTDVGTVSIEVDDSPPESDFAIRPDGDGDGDRILSPISAQQPNEESSKQTTISNGPPGVVAKLTGHTGVVYDVLFTPDARKIVSVGNDRMVRVWDVSTREQLHVLDGGYNDLAISEDGLLLASGSRKEISLWNVDEGKRIRLLTGQPGHVWSLDLSRDGQWVASGDGRGTIVLWDATTGEQLHTMHVQRGKRVHRLQFSPDARLLVSAAADSTIRVWSTATGEEQHQVPGWTYDLDFTPDGRRLCLSTNNAGLFSVPTLKRLRRRVYTGHTSFISSTTFSSDGSRLITTSGDRTVRLWDVVANELLHTFHGPGSTVNAAAISPDGRFAVTGGGGHWEPGGIVGDEDYSLWLWRLPQ